MAMSFSSMVALADTQVGTGSKVPLVTPNFNMSLIDGRNTFIQSNVVQSTPVPQKAQAITTQKKKGKTVVTNGGVDATKNSFEKNIPDAAGRAGNDAGDGVGPAKPAGIVGNANYPATTSPEKATSWFKDPNSWWNKSSTTDKLGVAASTLQMVGGKNASRIGAGANGLLQVTGGLSQLNSGGDFSLSNSDSVKGIANLGMGAMNISLAARKDAPSSLMKGMGAVSFGSSVFQNKDWSNPMGMGLPAKGAGVVTGGATQGTTAGGTSVLGKIGGGTSVLGSIAKMTGTDINSSQVMCVRENCDQVGGGTSGTSVLSQVSVPAGGTPVQQGQSTSSSGGLWEATKNFFSTDEGKMLAVGGAVYAGSTLYQNNKDRKEAAKQADLLVKQEQQNAANEQKQQELQAAQTNSVFVPNRTANAFMSNLDGQGVNSASSNWMGSTATTSADVSALRPSVGDNGETSIQTAEGKAVVADVGQPKGTVPMKMVKGKMVPILKGDNSKPLYIANAKGEVIPFEMYIRQVTEAEQIAAANPSYNNPSKVFATQTRVQPKKGALAVAF